MDGDHFAKQGHKEVTARNKRCRGSDRSTILSSNSLHGIKLQFTEHQYCKQVMLHLNVYQATSSRGDIGII